MGEIPRYISINEYDVGVKKNKSGEIISSAKAQLEVDGESIICEGEGCLLYTSPSPRDRG